MAAGSRRMLWELKIINLAIPTTKLQFKEKRMAVGTLNFEPKKESL